MTPEVIAALQALVGRELTAGELAALAPLVEVRDDAAVAALLSIGRVRIESRMLTERGVLSALGAEGGDAFLSSLEAIKSPDDLPPPLRSKYGAIRRAVGWLAKDGIDVADLLTRALLDALAATGVVQATSAQAIKRLAEHPAPIPTSAVTIALGGKVLPESAGLAVGQPVRVLPPFDLAYPEPLVIEGISIADDGSVVFALAGAGSFARQFLEPLK